MSVQIHAIRALKDNYIYAISDKNDQCAVVDPGDAAPVIAFLEEHELHLTHILCTHHHCDHVDGVNALVARFKVPVWTSQPDHARIPHSTLSLGEQDSAELLGEEMRVLEVPGHTLGQIAFWFPDLKALFVGDTLFSCGCGRLFEGTPEQMFTSLKKIATLPPNTEIYFGHEYTLRNVEFLLAHGVTDQDLLKYQAECKAKIARGEGTTPGILANELRLNPFLNAKSVEDFRHWREARNSW